MYDEYIDEQLQNIEEALDRICERSQRVKDAGDFLNDESGRLVLDSICMLLIAIGEAIKKIDRKTDGTLLSSYPEIDWTGIMGVRNVIAHAYFDIDAEEVFNICQTDVPALQATVNSMRQKKK